MRTYNEVIAELKALGIHAYEGEFYEYEGFLLESEFKRFFNFCQEYLDRDDLEFNISPARFYYNTNTTLNGLAWKVDKYYLVEIFKGSIFYLHKFYNSKKNVFNLEPLSHFKELTQKKGVEPEDFLFQISTLYFLYHEVGHLIQRLSRDVDNIEFMQHQCIGNEVPESHVRELDADWFSAHSLAMHAKEFAGVYKDTNNTDSEALIEIAALALAGIYMYFIDSGETEPKVYYQKKCHPHPSVRLSYMIIFFLENLSANLSADINQATILTKAIRYSEIMMLQNNKNIVEEFSLALQSELTNIEKYINKIFEDSKKYPYLCVNTLGKKSKD